MTTIGELKEQMKELITTLEGVGEELNELIIDVEMTWSLMEPAETTKGVMREAWYESTRDYLEEALNLLKNSIHFIERKL